MSTENNYALLIEAVQRNDLGDVRRLIPLFYQQNARRSALQAFFPLNTDNEDNVFEVAARFGHDECVALLLPHFDARANESAALRWAARVGHIKCLKLLIDVSDTKARGSEALALAAEYGHAECLALLLDAPHHDFMRDVALAKAVAKQRSACVDILYPLSKPQNALDLMQRQYIEPSVWEPLAQRIEAEQQRLALSAVVGQSEGVLKRKM